MSVSHCHTPLLFSDSQWERKYLRGALFQLRQYCRSLGLQFHAVSPYQHIHLPPDPSGTIYTMERDGVLQLALREIRLCQSLSAGPSFVVGESPPHPPPLGYTHKNVLLVCTFMQVLHYRTSSMNLLTILVPYKPYKCSMYHAKGTLMYISHRS